MSLLDVSIQLATAGHSHELVVASPDGFDKKFETFLEAVRDLVKQRSPDFDIRVDNGQKNIKLVRTTNGGSGSVYCFIDKTTGDILKPASSKTPAKGSRGNIFDEHNGLARMRWTGPEYNK